MSGIRRLLGFISIALVAETAAYSAITPLVPGLADEHGLSKGAAGLLTGAYPLGTAILAVPASWLAARHGPRRTVVGALLVLGGSTLVFGLASSTGLLIAARFAQGSAGAGIWAAGLAWVVAVAPRERRAEALGAAVGAAIAGALGGPVVGTVAHELGTGVVFGAFFAVPLALALVIARLPDPDRIEPFGLGALRAAAGERLVRRGVWLTALPGAAFGTFGVLVPLRLDALGAGAVTIGAAFLATVAVESVVSPVVGRIADRRGAIWPARIGLAGGGLAVALLPAPQAVVPVVGLLVVSAALLGMLWAPAMSLLADGAEAGGIDAALGPGVSNVAWGAGAALGGSAGGALAGVTADAVPYLLLALAALLTSALLR